MVRYVRNELHLAHSAIRTRHVKIFLLSRFKAREKRHWLHPYELLILYTDSACAVFSANAWCCCFFVIMYLGLECNCGLSVNPLTSAGMQEQWQWTMKNEFIAGKAYLPAAPCDRSWALGLLLHQVLPSGFTSPCSSSRSDFRTDWIDNRPRLETLFQLWASLLDR